MHPLSQNNVLLLILDLAEELAQAPHLMLERVCPGTTWGGFGDVDDAMHVERYFLVGGAIRFVAETVLVFSV